MQSKVKAGVGSVKKKQIDFSKYMVYIILAMTLIIFAIWLGGKFFALNNMLNITRQTAMISVMAVGMTFVIGSGNIDLSIGSVVAVCSLVCALILQATNNIPLAIVLTLVLGMFFGLVNGLLITTFKIPAFLVTLGMMNMGKGIAQALTNTKAVPVMNKTFNQMFGLYDIGGKIPILLIWTIIVFTIGLFAFWYLPFGRKVLAVGGNEVSAVYSGINAKRIIIMVMVISGLVASFAAILYTGRMETARYTFGQGAEMDVIAATVLGGTSMSGGTGSIVGAVAGSFLLGIINNGLILGGLDVAQQMIVSGALIIIAVALNSIGSRKKANS